LKIGQKCGPIPHVSYTWHPSAHLSCSTCLNPFFGYDNNTLTHDSTFIYTLVAHDSISGCTDSDQVMMTVHPAIIKILLSPGASTCGPATFTVLNPTNYTNYSWSVTNGVITSGNGTPVINVTWTTTSVGSVAVHAL